MKNNIVKPEPTEEKKENDKKSLEAIREEIVEKANEYRNRSKEANEAKKAGRGILTLEKSILSRDEKIKELAYDFNKLTGLEFAEAMDSDMNARQSFKITSKQALALFAKTAAKENEDLDTRDILERIGITDTIEAVELATLFYTASVRAGHLRISKWQ